ncbi:hypothetical protein IWX90DRAFT_294187 [Phyllosticta citrichinensis]|uniref:Uncharacterized protein n=1 Tax=Phyllosticta citrichinensis TaxID=1130410 RepID=A0ABR1XKE7_9PEZI
MRTGPTYILDHHDPPTNDAILIDDTTSFRNQPTLPYLLLLSPPPPPLLCAALWSATTLSFLLILFFPPCCQTINQSINETFKQTSISPHCCHPPSPLECAKGGSQNLGRGGVAPALPSACVGDHTCNKLRARGLFLPTVLACACVFVRGCGCGCGCGCGVGSLFLLLLCCVESE